MTDSGATLTLHRRWIDYNDQSVVKALHSSNTEGLLMCDTRSSFPFGF